LRSLKYEIFVHFWAAKNEPKSCPLQAAFFLRYAVEAGRKVFSLISSSTARLRRSLTKEKEGMKVWCSSA